MMNDFNYGINLIPEFRLRKKLLDITPIIVKGRVVRLNPIMTTNLLIMEKNTNKYMADKLAMLYNSIIRDKNLVVTGNGSVSRTYTIKYHDGKLSIIFGSNLTLTVTLSRKMNSLINSDIYIANKTNFAITLYVASAIMNIPKYEYPIPIIDNDVSISTISINDIDVLYVHNDVSPYPKKIKKINSTVVELLKTLKDRGDVISCARSIGDDNIARILSLINYCRYYGDVTPDLINLLLSNVSTIQVNYDHLENMIAYMDLYRNILNIKDKYINHIPKKHFN